MFPKILILALTACLLVSVAFLPSCENIGKPPIRVGVLHSQTGTMAISEKSVLNATLMAIAEINARGGVLGRQLEPVIADGASDPATFALRAASLIEKEKVEVIFGCWTSASRKAVVPVVENAGILLFYPLQYEGIEQSPNVVYTGATPNQQVIPAVNYGLANFGKKAYLVGSDYVFPRMGNAIINDILTTMDGQPVGESYLPLGSTEVDAIVLDIIAKKPDFILNTINGDSNVAFFLALRAAGITPQEIPTMSFSIGETELAQMDASSMAGDYAAWNYFQSISSPQNETFISAYRARFDAGAVTSDPMDSAYSAVHLWAQTVGKCKSIATTNVRQAIGGEGFLAPAGLVYVDPETQHTWKPIRIGKVRPDGQFDIVWSSGKAVRPSPFPITRTRPEWEASLATLRKGWGGRWAKPPSEDAR